MAHQLTELQQRICTLLENVDAEAKLNGMSTMYVPANEIYAHCGGLGDDNVNRVNNALFYLQINGILLRDVEEGVEYWGFCEDIVSIGGAYVKEPK